MQLTSIEGSGGQIIQGNEAEALIAECLAEYEGGSEAALYTLGVAFSTGSHGVVCDLIEAHKWFNIVAPRGSRMVSRRHCRGNDRARNRRSAAPRTRMACPKRAQGGLTANPA